MKFSILFFIFIFLTFPLYFMMWCDVKCFCECFDCDDWSTLLCCSLSISFFLYKNVEGLISLLFFLPMLWRKIDFVWETDRKKIKYKFQENPTQKWWNWKNSILNKYEMKTHEFLLLLYFCVVEKSKNLFSLVWDEIWERDRLCVTCEISTHVKMIR